MWILQWFMASFLFRLAGLVFSIAIYEIIRYLVINKVRQIGAKIKGWFTRTK
jgi:hypothetical protein